MTVSYRTPRLGAAHPNHSAPSLGSCFGLMTPFVSLSPNYFRHVEYLISIFISVSAPPFDLEGRLPAGVTNLGELASAAHVIEHRIPGCINRSHRLIDYYEL